MSNSLSAPPTSEANIVDVIVPIYRDLVLTQRCIQSLLSASQLTPYEVILINDCSPETELRDYLASLRDMPQVTLLENKHNLGFVASVNLGMSLHPERDVVLLNSDTEVANDWLDRLRYCALSQREIGTVTPFSNNATICSYPNFCCKNDLPESIELGDLDRIFRRVNLGKSVEIPTAVGFCMYIKRVCLNQVGLFDADRFGKGYGEENDFSMRAARKGWLNVLCADTFVFHAGGASFQSESAALQAKARVVLEELHPDYQEQVRRFIMRDPLLELRHDVDIELAMKRMSNRIKNAETPNMTLAINNTMKTLVCVNVEVDTAHLASETIRSIASSSLTCSGIVVATDSWVNFDRDAIVEAARETPLVFVSHGECLTILKDHLRDSGAVGVFLISSGMYLPYAFDVRLAKIAIQDASVSTVSPFCDISAIHQLHDLPVAVEDMQSQAVSRLDRLAFLLGQRSYFELPECLLECCYIPTTTVARMAQPNGHGGSSPQNNETRSHHNRSLLPRAGNGGKVSLREFHVNEELQKGGKWFGQLSGPGFLHVISDSVYVSKLPDAVISRETRLTGASHPQLVLSRNAILDAYRAGVDFRTTPGLDTQPVQLHVVHDLGGGSNKWLNDFCLADSGRINLVLKSFTYNNAAGGGVALYSHVLDEVPLRVWKFSNEIQATVVTHLEYRCALEAIIKDCCVDAVLVSSLIGHSMDVLNTGLPTVVINHDYFPYCAAINIYFDGVCQQCDEQRIGECYRGNPKFNPFVTFLPSERVMVREKFLEFITRPNTIMATPSRSVEDNFISLDKRFSQAHFVTIPHGYGHALKRFHTVEQGSVERLRIIVLGQLSVLKGSELLSDSLAMLTEFAEVFLVGCRELGELFKFQPSVHVVSQYEINQLSGHFAAINPHVGLLTSICPETFSYALTELMMLGLPVAAPRVGSFPERIRHQENGYLYEPDVASLVATMRAIDADRSSLNRIRENLRLWEPRTPEAMVSDYHRITPIDVVLYARYPAGLTFHRLQATHHSAREDAWPSSSITISSMWKEVKRSHLQISMSEEASYRAANHARSVENHFNHCLHERNEQFARAITEKNLEIQTIENHFSHYRQEQQERNEQLARTINEKNREIKELTTHVNTLTAHVNARDVQLTEILSSRSWRISHPLRVLVRTARRLKMVIHYLTPTLHDPASLPMNIQKLFRAWRSGGAPEVKRHLISIHAEAVHQHAWPMYHKNFRKNIRPRIIQRIDEMESQPLIGIIVPVFNTPPKMLLEMLQSVQRQLYPNWELCIADDSSSLPHVKKILKEYAAKDQRIKLYLGLENKGVSHASNRALEMASAKFVVLLDHDDILEEQALFRVAESILAENPDMVYSDEVMVSPDATSVFQYAYRPAFSLELLRGHPYFVHLVGFRTQLLRDVGGFDESLKISQDYDVFLRVTEKAQTVVHIPEVLYQWRIHGHSAGKQKMAEVMETSKTILQRHLIRIGETGFVNDGAGFNLFDVRYRLRDDLKVAIIIPTKNHGDLLRQCINSIGATVSGIQYDIVVVDHESDDPATLDYLSSISSVVQVLRYKGAFNFSAINNWAVSHLTGEYTHYLLCNNDIEAAQPGWLERMLELGQQPSVGIVGAMLLYPDRITIQHAGVCVGTYGAAEHYGKFLRKPDIRHYLGFSEIVASNHETSAVTAACLLIRKEAFEEISGFDEALAVGFGDVDMCLRVGAHGYRVLFCPHAELVHHESFTRGKSTIDPHPEDSAYFRSKWQELLQTGDPFFNPNLSLDSTAWQMKYPMNCSFGIRRRIVRQDKGSGMKHVQFGDQQC